VTDEHYAVSKTIGLGGMGEVVLARDTRLGRDVAIKRLRSASPSPTTLRRFMREAKIQARLDHPSIVPVHEVGVDAAGRPYFTMKRLTGTTLASVLKTQERPTLQLLLRTFVDVCNAVAFAHARDIVHRDLKPGNIMLGTYGEVHVIDWGVARVVDEDDATDPDHGIEALEDMTDPSTVLGTPGYLAPEQIESPQVGPAADVYALGAVLFEILAREPLHPRGQQALLTTAAGLDPSPRHRSPELQLPPELDRICARALAQQPAERPTATELAEAVQAYLDGDRDVEQRKRLAAAELAAARSALASDTVARRADAIRSAGRALALDPESREAAQLVTHLMLAPPREVPRELAAELSASESAMQQRQAGVGMRSQLAVLAFLLAAALNGLVAVWKVALIAGWSTVMLVIAYALSRRPAGGEMWLLCIGNAILSALLSRLFGPLIIAPVVSCIMAVSLTSYPQLMPHRRIVIAILLVGWLAPVLLEQAGMLPVTWEVLEGAIVSTSHVVRVHGTATGALLIGGNVLGIVVVGTFANALARSRREAQRAVEIQAWHLRQLLPST